MRIFVLGLPHTITSPRFCSCAYTMKAWNLCRMMKDRGHTVTHLGNETSHPIADENIAVATLEQWSSVYDHPGSDFYDISVDTPERQEFHRLFADNMRRALEERVGDQHDAIICRAYDHPGSDFYDISVDTPERQEFHRLFADNMRRALEERVGDQHDAIICITWGGAQFDATHSLNRSAFVVESGIGYQHSRADFRVFESYAWMHMLMGRDRMLDGNKWYWTVIPNAFDPEMFEYRESPDGYFLYLGRLNDDKGVGLAVDVARRVGRRLKIAGQGNPDRFLHDAPHVEYLGPGGVEKRKELLAGAAALFCPTYYVEPFGGVAVEAQLRSEKNTFEPTQHPF